MLPTKSTVAVLVAGLCLPGVAYAMPHQPFASSPMVQTVAMGCGFGRTQDAMGRCRHRFNLFDRHDHRHFHRYRERHCTPLDTPNGTVRRCRI